MLEFQINNQIVSGFIGIRNACTYLLNSRRRGSLSRFVHNISHFCQLAWKWKTFATAIIISMSIATATATQPKFSTASQTILWFADKKKKYWFWLKFVWHPWICPSKGYVESDELHIWQISDCLNKTTIYRWKMLLEIISRFFYFKNKIVWTKRH